MGGNESMITQDQEPIAHYWANPNGMSKKTARVIINQIGAVGPVYQSKPNAGATAAQAWTANRHRNGVAKQKYINAMRKIGAPCRGKVLADEVGCSAATIYGFDRNNPGFFEVTTIIDDRKHEVNLYWIRGMK